MLDSEASRAVFLTASSPSMAKNPTMSNCRSSRPPSNHLMRQLCPGRESRVEGSSSSIPPHVFLAGYFWALQRRRWRLFFDLQHTDYGAGVLSFCMRCWGFLIYSFYELMCMRILSRCAGPKPEPQRHSPVESILAWGAR